MNPRLEVDGLFDTKSVETRIPRVSSGIYEEDLPIVNLLLISASDFLISRGNRDRHGFRDDRLPRSMIDNYTVVKIVLPENRNFRKL